MTTTPKNRAERSDDPWIEDLEISSLRIPSCLYNLNNPTYIIGLITVLFYVLTSIYYVSFFDRLSLPFHTLNLPLSFYIFAAGIIFRNILFFTFPLLAVILVSYFMITIRKETLYKYKNNYYKNDSMQRFRELFGLFFYIILCIFATVAIFFSIAPHSLKENIFNTVSRYLTMPISFSFTIINPDNFVVVILFIYLLVFILTLQIYDLVIKKFGRQLSCKIDHIDSIYLDNRSMIHFLFTLLGLFFLISIISFIFYVPLILGNYAADDLISGKTDHIEMNISMLDKNSSLILNKTLILITQCNGNYYLIEKSNRIPANTSTYLYIIPETKVQMATLKRVEASVDHVS